MWRSHTFAAYRTWQKAKITTGGSQNKNGLKFNESFKSSAFNFKKRRKNLQREVVL